MVDGVAGSRGRVPLAALAGGLLLVLLLAGAGVGAPVPSDEAREPQVALLPCGHEVLMPLVELPLPDPEAIALHSEECPGIRPGARLSNGCTMNFVFTDATDLYVGTAGHCTAFVGQRFGTYGGPAFGTVVFRYYAGIGHDFALIRIDEDRREEVDPNMCAFHGPVDSEPVTFPGQPVHHYGWGFATMHSAEERARTGTLISADATTIHFESYGSGGDSGSPVTSVLGSGLGILTHGNGNPGTLIWGTHIEHALQRVHAAGFPVELVPGQLVEGVV